MAEWYKQIPNWLTFFRILLIPVFVLALSSPTDAMLDFAAVVFVIAAITDYADGLLARRYKAVSNFGKLLDPLADKILVMAALVMLVSVRDKQLCVSLVPAWMVVIVLARELWVTGLRAVAASQGTVVPAMAGGKVKSFLQMVAITALLLSEHSLPIMGYQISGQVIGLNILLVSIVFSLLSAVDYTVMIMAPGQATLTEMLKNSTSSFMSESGQGSDAGRKNESPDEDPPPDR